MLSRRKRVTEDAHHDPQVVEVGVMNHRNARAGLQAHSTLLSAVYRMHAIVGRTRFWKHVDHFSQVSPLGSHHENTGASVYFAGVVFQS
jgi:hypothetical protein